MAQSLRMKSSTRLASDSAGRKLSEVARHVVIPDGIVTTGWPAVRDRCKQFGILFDGWQHGIGRLTLGKRADGLYAAGVGGVVLSIPRQTGKTYLIGWLIFALCTLQPGLTVIWTAHRTRTSDETFEKMKSMAMRPKLRPHVLGRPRSANGQQQVLFQNGSRILFGAREHGFGRGFDEVVVLIFDEAQILTENAMSDMVPATNAAKNGLVLLMGTPPRPGVDPGEVFTNRRKDALQGDKDTVYVEFSADEDAPILNWDQLAKANPSYPHRTGKTAILRMQKLLGSDESFRREAYGIWDTHVGPPPLILPAWWRNTGVGEEYRPPGEGVVSYGVRFTPDGSRMALASARKFGEGDPIFVQWIESRSMLDGFGPVVDWIVARKGKFSMILIDGKSDAAAFHRALRRAGIPARAINFGEGVISYTVAGDAYSGMVNALRDETVVHAAIPGQKGLDDSVARSTRRKVGNQGGFGFDPMVPGEDSAAEIEAVSLARYAADMSKRVPSGSQRKSGSGVQIL